MSATTPSAESPCPRMADTSPSVAPEKLRICENVVAPRMMNIIMLEMAVVPFSDFISVSRLSLR